MWFNSGTVVSCPWAKNWVRLHYFWLAGQLHVVNCQFGSGMRSWMVSAVCLVQLSIWRFLYLALWRTLASNRGNRLVTLNLKPLFAKGQTFLVWKPALHLLQLDSKTKWSGFKFKVGVLIGWISEWSDLIGWMGWGVRFCAEICKDLKIQWFHWLKHHRLKNSVISLV